MKKSEIVEKISRKKSKIEEKFLLRQLQFESVTKKVKNVRRKSKIEFLLDDRLWIKKQQVQRFGELVAKLQLEYLREKYNKGVKREGNDQSDFRLEFQRGRIESRVRLGLAKRHK